MHVARRPTAILARNVLKQNIAYRSHISIHNIEYLVVTTYIIQHLSSRLLALTYSTRKSLPFIET